MNIDDTRNPIELLAALLLGVLQHHPAGLLFVGSLLGLDLGTPARE